MKRGSGIKDRDERSRGIEILIPNRKLSEDENKKKGIVKGRFFWVIMQHNEYMNIPDFKHEWYEEIKEKGKESDPSQSRYPRKRPRV